MLLSLRASAYGPKVQQLMISAAIAQHKKKWRHFQRPLEFKVFSYKSQ